MSGVVLDVIVIHNRCLWVPIILGPVNHEDHVWFEDRWMVASLCDE
jgi:hypothetical protein